MNFSPFSSHLSHPHFILLSLPFLIVFIIIIIIIVIVIFSHELHSSKSYQLQHLNSHQHDVNSSLSLEGHMLTANTVTNRRNGSCMLCVSSMVTLVLFFFLLISSSYSLISSVLGGWKCVCWTTEKEATLICSSWLTGLHFQRGGGAMPHLNGAS